MIQNQVTPHRTSPTGHHPQDYIRDVLFHYHEASNPLATPHTVDGDDDNTGGDVPSVRLSCVLKSRESGILRLKRGCRGLHAAATGIHHDVWDTVLCAGVPVSLRELVSLAAQHLGLGDDRQTHLRLLQCSWTLGWHVTSRDCDGSSRHYWGGGVTSDTTSRMLRGDWVEIEGTELCRGVPTSLLARVICGVQIRNVGKFMGRDHISDSVWQTNYNKEQDSVVFLLVRYAMAHPDVGRQRGPQHRPLCPGPLRNTHCLWKWYQRPATFRRGCWRPRPWNRHKRMFGATEEEQNVRKRQEARAWYDFVQTSNIIGHTNVRKDCDRPDSFLQSVMWC